MKDSLKILTKRLPESRLKPVLYSPCYKLSARSIRLTGPYSSTTMCRSNRLEVDSYQQKDKAQLHMMCFRTLIKFSPGWLIQVSFDIDLKNVVPQFEIVY